MNYDDEFVTDGMRHFDVVSSVCFHLQTRSITEFLLHDFKPFLLEPLETSSLPGRLQCVETDSPADHARNQHGRMAPDLLRAARESEPCLPHVRDLGQCWKEVQEGLTI